MTDSAYNYKFAPPQNDWLHLDLTTVNLQPRQSMNIPYEITVPARSAPGGHYYTLFASADIPSKNGVSSTIQAADLVYLTVNGTLTRVSHLQSSLHQLVLIRQRHQLQAAAGRHREHLFLHLRQRPAARLADTAAADLGRPYPHPGPSQGTHRSIPKPVLPGIYRASYGYKTDDASWIVQQTHWVIYIPPWFAAVVLGALLIAGNLVPRLKRRRRAKQSKSASAETPDKARP
ncbi:MAG: hypothetical protein WDN27_01275 [Candidatus Saccharibacteria bacterium]